LNFGGNQTVDADPGVSLAPVWLRDPALDGVLAGEGTFRACARLAAQETRGSAAAQWQVRMILQHGFGLATVYAGDFDPALSPASAMGFVRFSSLPISAFRRLTVGVRSAHGHGG